jgi:hypothetical protein
LLGIAGVMMIIVQAIEAIQPNHLNAFMLGYCIRLNASVAAQRELLVSSAHNETGAVHIQIGTSFIPRNPGRVRFSEDFF